MLPVDGPSFISIQMCGQNYYDINFVCLVGCEIRLHSQTVFVNLQKALLADARRLLTSA